MTTTTENAPANMDPVPADPEAKAEAVKDAPATAEPGTDGAKGAKPETFISMPPEALLELARLYGFGARKYGDDGTLGMNYRKGYALSLSYNALLRHALAWASGLLSSLDVPGGPASPPTTSWSWSFLRSFSAALATSTWGLTSARSGLASAALIPCSKASYSR